MEPIKSVWAVSNTHGLWHAQHCVIPMSICGRGPLPLLRGVALSADACLIAASSVVFAKSTSALPGVRESRFAIHWHCRQCNACGQRMSPPQDVLSLYFVAFLGFLLTVLCSVVLCCAVLCCAVLCAPEPVCGCPLWCDGPDDSCTG